MDINYVLNKYENINVTPSISFLIDNIEVNNNGIGMFEFDIISEKGMEYSKETKRKIKKANENKIVIRTDFKNYNEFNDIKNEIFKKWKKIKIKEGKLDSLPTLKSINENIDLNLKRFKPIFRVYEVNGDIDAYSIDFIINSEIEYGLEIKSLKNISNEWYYDYIIKNSPTRLINQGIYGVLNDKNLLENRAGEFKMKFCKYINKYYYEIKSGKIKGNLTEWFQ